MSLHDRRARVAARQWLCLHGCERDPGPLSADLIESTCVLEACVLENHDLDGQDRADPLTIPLTAVNTASYGAGRGLTRRSPT